MSSFPDRLVEKIRSDPDRVAYALCDLKNGGETKRLLEIVEESLAEGRESVSFDANVISADRESGRLVLQVLRGQIRWWPSRVGSVVSVHAKSVGG